MHKKIGTLLDEKLLKKVKERATAEHTTLSHLFEKALLNYLSHGRSLQVKLSTVETSFGVFRLPLETVQKIAQEDLNETE